MILLPTLAGCLLVAKEPPAIRRQLDPGDPVHVAAGLDTACAVYESGHVACSKKLKDVPNDGVYLSVDAGYGWCAVRMDGTLTCYGDGVSDPSGEYTKVSMGWEAACAIDEDGELECWSPVDDDALADAPTGAFQDVSVGERNACGVTDGGDVLCWGDEESEVRDEPRGDFDYVAVADDAACAVYASGGLECWGDGGQHGLLEAPDGDFQAITGGWSHFCALALDGSVECWGDDTEGQADPPLGTFLQIDAGDTSTCGVRNDGDVQCWGALASVSL
ncbi:MAG: RCC1 domain-containing protein [Myxococcota bacterium]